MKPDLKTVKELTNPKMKNCPHCGHDEYYINVYISGDSEYFYRYDGEDVYNGQLVDALQMTDKGKFAYCARCDRRVFRFKA